jgi:glycosyltransferase involved in cell wall biosynthesis
MGHYPSRILMTADTVGGVWTYAVELCAALAPHGVEIALATMGAPLNDFQRREVARLDNVRVYDGGSLKLEWMPDPWEDVERAGEWLVEIERAERPDVVHLNAYAHAALPWSAPTLVVGHSCVCSWWQAVKREPAPSDWDRYRELVARGLRRADMVAAPSRAMRAALRRHYDPLPSAAVIHNARDARRYAPRPQHEKEPVVVSAGRLWDEAKNLMSLEHVAPHLPWPVYVAGEQQAPGQLNGRGNQSGKASGVHALGRLDEAPLADWMSRAAVYAHPARYEPFGLSVLEAALSGCALVLGDIDSLRELWGEAAEFVPPDDDGALRAAIWRLIDSPARRAELAERATVRARRYTPERMARGYLAAYREATAQRPRNGDRRVPSAAAASPALAFSGR